MVQGAQKRNGHIGRRARCRLSRRTLCARAAESLWHLLAYYRLWLRNIQEQSGREPTNSTKISHIIYWVQFYECLGSESIVQLHLIKTNLKNILRTCVATRHRIRPRCMLCCSRKILYFSFRNSFPWKTNGGVLLSVGIDNVLCMAQGRIKCQMLKTALDLLCSIIMVESKNQMPSIKNQEYEVQKT